MSKPTHVIIVDGHFIKDDQPILPANSRGLMYGDGCFETFCAYKERFFKLSEHLNRLKKGLEYLHIDIPSELNIGALKETLSELLQKNDLQDKQAIIRLQVWREGGRGYAVDASDSHYAVMALPRKKRVDDDYKLATVDVKRIPSAALPSNYKFTNGLNYISAAKQARDKGADDALMETINGMVSETTIANIFWLTNNTIYTPSKKCDILPGVTRSVVLHLLSKHAEVRVKEGSFTVDELKKAELVWICNSVKEIAAVSRLDDIHFNCSHSFLEKLKAHFKTYLNQHLSQEV